MKRLAKTAGATALLAGVALILERFLVAAPHHRGPKSDHFDGRRFYNQQPGWQSEGSFLKWQMNRRRGAWRDWVEAPPGPAPEARVDDGRLRVTLVNHATTLIQLDGVNLLTDPIWSERCSPVSWAGPKRRRPPGIRFEDLPPIHAVLISHNHYDHLDRPTLRALRRSTVITHLGNGAVIPGGARELDWWQELAVGDRVRVTAVPAQHFSSRGLSDRNANLWGGFVITGPSGSVYFAGDTGWGKHFAEIGKRFGPVRLALLPVGSYLPRWFMKPAHIDPAEMVDAHFELGARMSVPMHYGTFELGDDGETEGIDELRRIADRRGANIRILEFGAGFEIP
ncbi:MAG TPA: MBL fold metallo-hydrolase [Thermoanaerobaculia bacterium]|nr:MBL fold metallo-hydrolase [Thermoanaerobaculia bacterium]